MKSTGIIIAEIDPTIVYPLWKETPIPVGSKRIIGFTWGTIRELVSTVYARVSCNGNQIIPRTGKIHIAPMPLAVGYYQMIPCDIILEGPPYNMVFEASATGGGETGRIAVLLAVTNAEDETAQILDDLDKMVKLLGGKET